MQQCTSTRSTMTLPSEMQPKAQRKLLLLYKLLQTLPLLVLGGPWCRCTGHIQVPCGLCCKSPYLSWFVLLQRLEHAALKGPDDVRVGQLHHHLGFLEHLVQLSRRAGNDLHGNIGAMPSAFVHTTKAARPQQYTCITISSPRTGPQLTQHTLPLLYATILQVCPCPQHHPPSQPKVRLILGSLCCLLTQSHRLPS